MTIATGGNDMPEGDIEVFHADEAWRIRTEAGGTTPSPLHYGHLARRDGP